MNAPLTLLAITAVAGLFVMALVGFNSEITGQGINIERLSPEMTKKLIAAGKKEQQPPSQPPAETKTVCDCPDYGDNIKTVKQATTIYAGISYFDCILFYDVWKLREKTKMSTQSLQMAKTFCAGVGWWPE